MFIIVVDINHQIQIWIGDFVITYSLDNYITIKGKVNDQIVDYEGYLINPNKITGEASNNDLKYRGIDIEKETLRENLIEEDEKIKLYNYNKIAGVKYYYNEEEDNWFSLNNSGDRLQSENFKEENDAAQRYYEEAKEFTQIVLNEFGNLKTTDAVDKDGNKTVAGQNGWRRIWDF